MAGATREIKVNPTSKGLAIIITNDYDFPGSRYKALSGTFKDGERLKKAFEALKFDVYWKRNKNQEYIQQLWREINSFDFEPVKHYKCIAFAFSGHGEPEGLEGKLIMQDGTKIDICEDFISPVLPGKAPKIGDVPKIFFIDACRGDDVMETVDAPRQVTDKGSPNGSSSASQKGCHEIELRRLPKEANFLVTYSTLPGYRSNDYVGKGSLWLEILARHLQVNPASIENLLTDVNTELLAHYETNKLEFQQPEKRVYLSRRVYLLGDGSKDGRHRHQTSPTSMELDLPLDTPTSVHTQQPTADQRVSQGGSSSAQSQESIQRTPVQSSSNGRVSRSKGTGRYCARLKQLTNPKFEYITDRSSDPPRHHCTISYYKDGSKNYMDSGYYTSQVSAEEQAAKKILSRENWLP